jgi:probable addiction module antidote protein
MQTSKKHNNTGRATKRKGAMPTVDYEDHLFEDLRDLDYAAGYLTTALEEGEDIFLLAVRDVVQAQVGMSALSQATSLNRESLYTMLSKEGNPRLSSITSVLTQLGLEIKFAPKHHGINAA